MFNILMAFGFGAINGMIYMALVVKLYKRSKRMEGWIEEGNR